LLPLRDGNGLGTGESRIIMGYHLANGVAGRRFWEFVVRARACKARTSLSEREGTAAGGSSRRVPAPRPINRIMRVVL
jgi:hypothetical protein